MKKYTKNKNFIPEKFYYKMELKEKKNQTKIILLFLLINSAMLPTFSKDIKKTYEKPSITNVNIKEDDANLKNVATWVKNTFEDDIEEVYITNDTGEIVVDSIDKINNLNLNGSINVKDINLTSDKKYKLGVSLNE